MNFPNNPYNNELVIRGALVSFCLKRSKITKVFKGFHEKEWV